MGGYQAAAAFWLLELGEVWGLGVIGSTEGGSWRVEPLRRCAPPPLSKGRLRGVEWGKRFGEIAKNAANFLTNTPGTMYDTLGPGVSIFEWEGAEKIWQRHSAGAFAPISFR